MATVEVQPVSHDMFDRVWPLLEDFGSGKMSREDWRRMLFDQRWRSESDPYGYVLLDDGEPKGFIGTIFSRQRVGERDMRFCNLSSWIVKQEHRMQALRMLRPVLEDASTTFTALTLIGATTKIFRRFGFTELEREALVMSPLSGLTRPRGLSSLSWTHDEDEIAATLQGRDAEVFRHHRGTNCGHLLLQWRNRYCYVLTTRWVLKRQGVSHVHYVSDEDTFWSHLGSVQWALLRAHGTWFTMIDKRQAGRRTVPFGLVYALPRPRLFRPARSCEIAPADVSALYSEVMYLRV